MGREKNYFNYKSRLLFYMFGYFENYHFYSVLIIIKLLPIQKRDMIIINIDTIISKEIKII